MRISCWRRSIARFASGSHSGSGGEGEIRTHETCEGLPVFKSGHPHVCVSHSHANAFSSIILGVPSDLCFPRFGFKCNLKCNLIRPSSPIWGHLLNRNCRISRNGRLGAGRQAAGGPQETFRSLSSPPQSGHSSCVCVSRLREDTWLGRRLLYFLCDFPIELTTDQTTLNSPLLLRLNSAMKFTRCVMGTPLSTLSSL
jgi:hypothetical protein